MSTVHMLMRVANLSLWALAWVLTASPAAASTVTPITMGMTSLSESCISGCVDGASYARSLDSADAPDGTFAPLTVQTVVGAGANSFAASAVGSTALLGNSGLRVTIALFRPAVGMPTGSYSAGAQLNFSFVTDDTPDPVLSVDYSVDFVRPVSGSDLDAGISLTQAFNVPVEPAQATSGRSSGTWVFHLLPNRFYSGHVSAGIGVAFNAPGGLGAEQMNALFTIDMPSFAQPVPEPRHSNLLLAGLVLLAATRWRYRAGRGESAGGCPARGFARSLAPAARLSAPC